jgi:hypothetical protein
MYLVFMRNKMRKNSANNTIDYTREMAVGFTRNFFLLKGVNSKCQGYQFNVKRCGNIQFGSFLVGLYKDDSGNKTDLGIIIKILIQNFPPSTSFIKLITPFMKTCWSSHMHI